MLRLIHASVADQRTAAIVNAANRALAGGGGVDGAIHAAAGPGLDRACRAIGRCGTGQAVVTGSFDLEAKTGCRWIVHTVGPIWSRETPERAASLLASCYRTSCDAAEEVGAASISFCSISTGVYGYPLDKALPIAFETLLAASPRFDEIRFCLYGEDEWRRGVDIAHACTICHDSEGALVLERMR